MVERTEKQGGSTSRCSENVSGQWGGRLGENLEEVEVAADAERSGLLVLGEELHTHVYLGGV